MSLLCRRRCCGLRGFCDGLLAWFRQDIDSETPNQEINSMNAFWHYLETSPYNVEHRSWKPLQQVARLQSAPTNFTCLDSETIHYWTLSEQPHLSENSELIHRLDHCQTSVLLTLHQNNHSDTVTSRRF